MQYLELTLHGALWMVQRSSVDCIILLHLLEDEAKYSKFWAEVELKL
jgi:hypothetical protein